MENRQIIETLKKGAQLLSPRECTCFDLAGNSLYLVDSGIINTFCAERKAQGEFGEREFVAHFAGGELLFPVSELDHRDSSFSLIGSALPGSCIYRLEKKIHDLIDNPGFLNWLVKQSDNWLYKLSLSLGREGALPECRIITPADIDTGGEPAEFELNTGENIRPSRGIVWFTVESGFCVLCGDEEQMLLAEGASFPLSSQLWLTCLEPVKVTCRHSIEVISKLDSEKYINDLYGYFFRSFLLSRHYFRENAKARRRKLSKLEDIALESSVEELSGLVSKKQVHFSASAETLANPFFASLDVMGQLLDIKFDFPPEIEPGLTGHDLLVELLEYSSVYFRTIKLEGNWPNEESTHMVVFRKDGEYPLVLINRGKANYHLYDPATNHVTKLTSRQAAELEPEAYTLYRQFKPEKITTREFIRFAFRDLNPVFKLAFIVGLCGGLISMAPSYVTSIIFNSVIPRADMFQLYQIGIILVTASFTSILFGLLRSLLLLKIKTFTDYHLQAAVISRMLRLPVSIFKRFSTGDLAQRVMGIESIREVLSSNVTQSVSTVLFALPNLILIFYFSWKLALAGCAALVILFIAITLVGIVNYFNQREQIGINGELSGFFMQILTGINKIRNSGSENRAFVRWASRFADEVRYYRKSLINSNTLLLFNSFYPALISGVFFYLVGATWKGSLNVGNYLAFNSAFTSIVSAVSAFAGIIPALMSVAPIYQRLKPVLETLPENDESMKTPGKLDGLVQINNVSFRYNPESPVILDNVSISAGKGEFIAIAGPSGAGKSTLVRLLLGFESPERGGIYYSGNDLWAVDKRKLRKQLGVVLQDTGLFFGSIFENITGAGKMSIDEAWEAAKLAGIAEDIENMPMGMHTVVGNGTLSMGQKQRILIARALAKKPKIVIFDEATSALDNVTQAVISESLSRFNATRIVIAHRLSTIENADKIFVLDKGKIVQNGTFQELISQPGLFQVLAKRQMV